MSRFTFAFILLVCIALVGLPLWASWKGVGEPTVSKSRDSSGRVLYVGSRGWVGGGPSGGK